MEEIIRLRQKTNALEQQIIRDPLTGLYNKRHFDDVLYMEMERTRRSLAPTSLILVDLDRFKTINDTLGHLVGDQVLVQTAHVLTNELRMIDVPCRYGGEEFAIILPGTPLLIAIQVAERLRIAVSSATVSTDKGGMQVTASFGVSCFQHHQKAERSEFIERADQKLYEAKRKGRNSVCAETPDAASSSVSQREKAALHSSNISNLDGCLDQ